jgi:hypothetical protein
VRRCQDEVTAEISELLSVPLGFAAAFLWHCRWNAERLKDEWFSDEGRVRCAVGLAAAGRDGDVPTALNALPLTCAICFDPYSPGEMRSAGCSHYYCHECWRGFIRAAAGDGPRCLLIRCARTLLAARCPLCGSWSTRRPPARTGCGTHYSKTRLTRRFAAGVIDKCLHCSEAVAFFSNA